MGVRVLHTADWHLGRIFHGVHLTADQAHVLDQLVSITSDVRPDLLVVAGDVYDRAVPPPEAVELLDDVLTRLVLDLGTRVLVIAGNHDSPSRLEFGSRLTAARGLHVFGALEARAASVRADGIEVVALPYAEPAAVRATLGGETATHDDAMRARLAALPAPSAGTRHRVLAAHVAVRGASTCDSERPIGPAESGTVDAALLGGFAYVALGHLHRPQSVGTERIRYSGSILKYSFSEASDAKSALLVEIGGDGRARTRSFPLAPRRDVRRIAGKFDEILRDPAGLPSRDDYLAITLVDRAPILDAMGRLREVYPNLLVLDREILGRSERSELLEARGRPLARRPSALEERALFARFFEDTTGQALSTQEQTAFAATLARLAERERETVP